MPSIAQLLAAGSNPFMPEGNQKIINMLMEQELQKRDPSYQMGLEKSRIELDNLRNPRMSPYEEQQIRLNQQDNVRDDRRLGLDERKFDFERDSAGLTDDLKEYDRYAAQETAAGRQPLGVLDFMLRMKQAGASSTNVTVGEGDKFYENLDKKNAETFAALSEAGVNGAAKLAQIDRLEGLLATAPQGGAAMLKQFAGEYGINTEGLDDIQAAQALINELVPQQRQPGSGPMSDADLALFKQSLPRVINQPGGNKLIVDTMRGITQYQVQMGRIADAVADREITPAEARKAIRSLPNPLGNFKVPANTTAPSAMPDVGKMSDDELRAIINGK